MAARPGTDIEDEPARESIRVVGAHVVGEVLLPFSTQRAELLPLVGEALGGLPLHGLGLRAQHPHRAARGGVGPRTRRAAQRALRPAVLALVQIDALQRARARQTAQ